MFLVPIVALLVVAPLGAVDVLWFHVWRFRLAERPESRAETVTHVVRALLIGTFALLVARYEPHGAWFWLVAALLVGDVLNNLADVLLEPGSRASLGGLPPAEYVIHVVGATASGAVAASFLLTGWAAGWMPTELAPAHLPPAVAVQLPGVALACFALAALETALLVRGWARERRATAAVAA